MLFDVGSNVEDLEAKNRLTLAASVPLGPLEIIPRGITGLTRFLKALTNKSSTCNESNRLCRLVLAASITDISPIKRI